MTPEQFLQMAELFPEPMFLVSGNGEVLAANQAVTQQLGLDIPTLCGKQLAYLVAEPQKKVAKYLRACLRTREMVFGSLTFHHQSKKTIDYHCEGTLVQPRSNDTPSYILIRLVPKKDADQRFVALNQQITDLTKEVAERQKVEEESIRNYQNQEVLNTLMQISLENTSLDELLERALDVIFSTPWLTTLPKGSIFLVEDEPDVLVLKAQRDLSTPLLTKCARVPFGHCLCGLAAASKKSQFANCVDDRHTINFESMTGHGHYNIPILLNDEVAGVLNLYLPEGHRSTPNELAFLEVVANTLAGLIQRKRSEVEVAKLSGAVEQSVNTIYITNKEGVIEYVNPAFEKLTGYTREEAIGKTPRILKSGKHDQAYYEDMWQTILSGQVYQGVSINRKKDGDLYHEEKTITPVKNRHGEIVRFLTTAVDITHRLQLEQQLQEVLERRGLQVHLSTEIAQEIALAADLTDLYQRVVTLIKEQFGYYHVQLLRHDSSLDTVALVVGYGEIGERMLAMNHSMPMGVGLIGVAAATGQSTLRPDVTDDPNWRPNSFLPHTKSEVSVPIKLKNKVLGVLDVQSDVVGGLGEEDQLLLEGLCGQIAIAIENTRLQQETEIRIHELRTLQRHMSHEGWSDYEATKLRSSGFQFDYLGVQSLTDQALSMFKNESDQIQVATNGKTKASVSANHRSNIVKTPLTVWGTTFGALGVKDDPERLLSDEENEFLDAVAEQVAEALEAARLFEKTQDALTGQEQLASELRTVAEVSTAASTILDVDNLLQTVVELVKLRFSLYHVHIYQVNKTKDALILQAGAGDVGQIMVLEGRKIPYDAELLVARAARTQRDFIENDVRKIIDFLPHPLLPDTRAEMAIPLMVGGQLIGVMDLQSDQVGFFTEEAMQVQRTLASQIAVAVQNATMYADQVETSSKLRQVDKLKSEFLASMSHELRTPLNSIIGFADVLLEGLDGELNERMEQDVRLIRDSGAHLRDLIGDILDMSKIEAGRMELRYEEIDMRQIASDILATASPLAQEKNLELILSLSDDVGIIAADRTRLRQVLWNIMGNGIKFTEKGSVTLSMQVIEDMLRVTVRDTGIGIKPEDMAVVFEQFQQVDGSLNRSVGGTGLGMPITKKLIELHGGEIGVDSVPGQGSTFWFTLPIQQGASRQKRRPTGPLPSLGAT